MRRFLRDCTGAVAAEMALVAGLLIIIIVQLLDYGWMTYNTIQVRMAAQAAAAEAATLCIEEEHLPATVNCESEVGIVLLDKMQAAANRVSIGNVDDPTITISAPVEGYYCTDPANDNALVEVGDLSNRPADCTAYSSEAEPGNFIFTTASYQWQPMFPGLSAASANDRTIRAVGWMRLD